MRKLYIPDGVIDYADSKNHIGFDMGRHLGSRTWDETFRKIEFGMKEASTVKSNTIFRISVLENPIVGIHIRYVTRLLTHIGFMCHVVHDVGHE